MKKLLAAFLSLVMVLSTSVVALADTPSISLEDTPQITVSVYKTVKEIKRGQNPHLEFGPDGAFVHNGIIYPSSSGTYTVHGEFDPNKAERFMMDGKTYKPVCIEARSNSVTTDDDDNATSSTIYTYALTNPRTATQADYDNAYMTTTSTTTIKHDNTEKKYVDTYFIDGKSVTEAQYSAYKGSHAYKEQSKTTFSKELSREFESGKTTLEKIVYKEDGKSITLKDGDPIPGYGVAIYYYTVDEYYKVVDEYSRTHNLTTLDSGSSGSQGGNSGSQGGSQGGNSSSQSGSQGGNSGSQGGNQGGNSGSQSGEAQGYTTFKHTSIIKHNNYVKSYKEVYKLGDSTVSQSAFSAAKKNCIEKITTSTTSESEPVLTRSETILESVTFTKDGTTRSVRFDSNGNILDDIKGPGMLRYNYVTNEYYDVSRVYSKVHTLTLNAKAKLSRVKPAKKALTIKWKKLSKKERKKISGYQIQVSQSRNFSGAKVYTAGKNKSSKKVKLQRKTRYYVRMRTVKGNVYGAWSAVKSAKTK